MTIPSTILEALDRADASWRPLLVKGLEAMMAATRTTCRNWRRTSTCRPNSACLPRSHCRSIR
jgi:hypothetical protein